MLHGFILRIAIGGDFVLALDQDLGALVYAAQGVETDGAQHEQEHHYSEERREQLRLKPCRKARDQADNRIKQPDHVLVTSPHIGAGLGSFGSRQQKNTAGQNRNPPGSRRGRRGQRPARPNRPCAGAERPVDGAPVYR